MSTSSLPSAFTQQGDILELFQEKPPVLVEVRFPHMGTSSDWFLCENVSEFEAIAGRMGPGAEAHLTSVWDLLAPTGRIVVKK